MPNNTPLASRLMDLDRDLSFSLLVGPACD